METAASVATSVAGRSKAMNTDAVQRGVERIDEPPMQPGMSPPHRVRQLVAPGNWDATDPFLLLMEDWFPHGAFDWHPHRGIETVTYVIDGELEHRDNAGHAGTIRAGDAQWMTAGRGLLHVEQPPEGVTVHSLQLWINLPASDKMAEPRYQDLVAADLPIRRELGATVRVYSGASGQVVASTKNHVPVTMVEVRLDPGASISQELPGDYNAFLLILEGEGRIGLEQTGVRSGQVVWLTRASKEQPSEVLLTATAEKPLRALLFSGRPLREPVVARGPFVMNTEDQIREAYADYRAGKFGSPEIAVTATRSSPAGLLVRS
jgi:quercetin 2,3-dioxygenase